ncbi:CAP domain-containing protein [Streptomyces sp. NPDC046203]|uniref:CAP domain-containing protein n=1 Tax=Streptomyces sp. NPDC046203 TaxID=3154602 RepID=UPI003407F077
MGRHRGIRRGAPVRTGLLGVSVAVVAGAIAVATGLVPGGEVFTFGSTSADGRQAAQAGQAAQAPRLTTQGGASANAESPTGQRTGAPVASGSGDASPTPPASQPSAPAKPAAPAKPSPSKAAPSPEAPVSEAPKPATPKPPQTAAPVAPAKPEAPKPVPVPVAPAPPEPAEKPAPQTPAPVPTPTPTPTPTPAPTAAAAARPLAAREAAAEAEVIRLVNLERAKVGCSAVRADADLASLAGALSADMAARNFFDHTDPDGATPWARAAKAGVTGLGAENIARGQVDAAAVMASWMASDGHRANILNCMYTSLGVGVHFGSAGPWWTQDFGV